jgi:hypothetical protein
MKLFRVARMNDKTATFPQGDWAYCTRPIPAQQGFSGKFFGIKRCADLDSVAPSGPGSAKVAALCQMA